MATCIDVTVAFGSDQLCAGLSSVIEGAIHASSYGWGVLMVDASNFFNTLNRTAMLLQVCMLWPHCARFLSIHIEVDIC